MRRRDADVSTGSGQLGWVVLLACGLLTFGVVGCDSQGGQSDQTNDQTGQSAGMQESDESGDEGEQEASDEESGDDEQEESSDESDSEAEGDAGETADEETSDDKSDKAADKKATPPKVTGKLTGSVSEQGTVKTGKLELMVRDSGEVVGRFTGESDKKFRMSVKGKVTDNNLKATGGKGNNKVTVTGPLSSSGADVDVAGTLFGNNFEFGTKLTK